MNPGLYEPLVERAFRIAARAHDGQTRKGSDLPYLVHPTAVALILARVGIHDAHVIAAAVLHDVVEDTPATLEDLQGEFPADVLEIVEALTEQKLDDAGNKRSWSDRKQAHVAHMAQASPDAQAVLLADKLHNLSSMLHDLEIDGGNLWRLFGAPRADVLGYYRSMLDAVEPGRRADLRSLHDACADLLRRLSEI